MSSGSIVRLNIGGTKFETSKSTLTKFDGRFKTMLETDVPIAKDDSGSIFIDRSPKHFEDILNFMRDGKVKLPDSEKEVKEIQIEAQYYRIAGLNAMCYGKLRKLIEAKASLNGETSIPKLRTAMPTETNVKLDIGGTIFKTSKSTLAKFDGMFKTMLETNVPVAKDESGSIFVDRDARNFHVILNYMRDGIVKLPDAMQEVEEIQIEAQYYLLTGLNELCEEKLRKMAETKAPFDEDVQVLHKHGEMIQVIAEPKKPVLIIYYHVDSHGKTIRPQGFYIKSFLDRYKNKLNIFFRAFTDYHSWASEKPSIWRWSLHYNTDWSYRNPLKEDEVWSAALEKNITDFFTKNRLLL